MKKQTAGVHSPVVEVVADWSFLYCKIGAFSLSRKLVSLPNFFISHHTFGLVIDVNINLRTSSNIKIRRE